jgi:hypothetical protein
VTGLPVTVDATELSLGSFCLSVATARSWPTSAPQQLRLLPGPQRIGTGTTFVEFTVGPTGQVGVDQPRLPVRRRRHAPAHRAARHRRRHPAAVPELLPVRHGLPALAQRPAPAPAAAARPQRFDTDGSGYDFALTLAPSGRFSSDPGLRFVTGQGTASLVVGVPDPTAPVPSRRPAG